METISTRLDLREPIRSLQVIGPRFFGLLMEPLFAVLYLGNSSASECEFQLIFFLMLYREHLGLPIIEALWLYPCARQQELSELFCLLYYVISEEYYAAIWNSAIVQKRRETR